MQRILSTFVPNPEELDKVAAEDEFSGVLPSEGSLPRPKRQKPSQEQREHMAELEVAIANTHKNGDIAQL